MFSELNQIRRNASNGIYDNLEMQESAEAVSK